MGFPKTYRTNVGWAMSVGAVLALIAGRETITRVAIIGLVIFGASGATWSAWEHKWLHGKTRWIAGVLLIWGGISLFGWFSWPTLRKNSSADIAPQPPVYAEFRGAFSRYGQELGNTKENPIETSAYEAWHEKATVLWIYELREWVIMPHDSLEWIEEHDTGEWRECLRSDTCLKKLFGKQMPSGKNPPFGGLATLFLTNVPKYVQEVGWRNEDCWYNSPSIHLQRFEHGWVVGNLRHSISPTVTYGDQFLLLDDHKKHPVGADTAAPYVSVDHTP
jgi:hypothetical protein